MLTVGQSAPLDIAIHDENGQAVKLRDLLGSTVVLYFYPEDDTPGCTTEACQFRDQQAQFQELGVKVIGVSQDSAVSHQKFKTKYQLNFPLWVDADHQLAEASGVWVEKSFLGKKYMGMARTTFVIDSQGKIIKVWEKVSPVGHAAAVKDFLDVPGARS